MGKNAVAVVLIVLIIGAIVVAITRVKGGGASDKGKSAMLARVVSKWDVDENKAVEVPQADFLAKIDEQGYHINPENGHKLVDSITCANCGKIIPTPPIPPDTPAKKQSEIFSQYNCPLCGKSAFPRSMPPTVPARAKGKAG